jgi:A/G-specific adenine glycosylase
MPVDWFARRLLDWFDRHGRHDLPWQQDRDPYRVWVSEIMLQQTQVTTVIPYYQRFMARFPVVAALAAAELDDVLHHWTGLGYYARGRNLHRAARAVMRDHGGRFPDDVDVLAALPGIGRSTAGAIAAIAFHRRAAILDGNVKRVLARYHTVAGFPGDAGPLRNLWQHADAHTPADRVADYTQAIMDLGATVCTRSRPRCQDCPVRRRCAALAQNRVAELPERRAPRAKPVRAARLFLVTDPDRRCLLERRPANGLWGGLWTPPQRQSETRVADVCREFGIDIGTVATDRVDPAFRHTFTHFHLDIEPVHVALSQAAAVAADRDDVRWYALSGDQRQPALGLSAPAVRLLRTLT